MEPGAWYSVEISCVNRTACQTLQHLVKGGLTCQTWLSVLCDLICRQNWSLYSSAQVEQRQIMLRHPIVRFAGSLPITVTKIARVIDDVKSSDFLYTSLSKEEDKHDKTSSKILSHCGPKTVLHAFCSALIARSISSSVWADVTTNLHTWLMSHMCFTGTCSSIMLIPILLLSSSTLQIAQLLFWKSFSYTSLIRTVDHSQAAYLISLNRFHSLRSLPVRSKSDTSKKHDCKGVRMKILTLRMLGRGFCQVLRLCWHR